MERAEFIRLLSPEAQQLMSEVGELDNKTDVVQLVSKLRARGFDNDTVAAVLTQAKLRRRARAKFGDFAGRMLFSEQGLEQASRLEVAALHAGRFRAAGLSKIADLGCGIGTESMAMAALGLRVSAFDQDEVTAAIATYNLGPFEEATVEQADVTSLDLEPFDAYFLDPARRELGGSKTSRAIRKFDPADYSPSFDFVLETASRRPTGVKLGPGHPHDQIPETAEAQWISVGGDLVELTLWFGSLARPGVARSALLIDAQGKHEICSASRVRTDAPIGELGAYVYEPDAAIIRSHLIGELATELDLSLFAAEIAYLTGNRELKSPWLKGYRVIDCLTFDRKKLKAYLREREIGILEIKKRGSDIVPEELRKELAPRERVPPP